jgi:hypothetical protein
VNEAQIERWNGSESDHWFQNADRYDAQLAPFLTAIVETARIDGDAVLDVGCGCGALSLTVAPSAMPTSAPRAAAAPQRSLRPIVAARALARGYTNRHAWDGSTPPRVR